MEFYTAGPIGQMAQDFEAVNGVVIFQERA
jgi:hypothetical protein